MKKTLQAFILSQPPEMKAPEVAKLAVAAGYAGANAAKVHTVRWRQRRDNRPATGGKPPTDTEIAALRKQILYLGLNRARPVFEEVQRTFDSLGA